MKNQNAILENLILLIQDYADCDAIIENHTQIENELGITGDDAYDLIIKVSKHFKVDISNFEFDKYFSPEPNGFCEVPVPIDKKELTINDLYDAIQKGKL